MRNSSFISLPLWPKQLVTVCGHVGLPAFGREQGTSQSHVRVQPVSSWKEFPQRLLPQMWQKQRHHEPSQGMGSFEAELRHSALWTIRSTFLLAAFSCSCLQGAKVSLPFQHRAPECLSGLSISVLCAPFGCRRAVKCSSGTLKEECWTILGVSKLFCSMGTWVASTKTSP